MHADESVYAEAPVYVISGELPRTRVAHFVPTLEEVFDAVIDVVIDRPIRLQPGAMVEVRRPATQHPVELVTHHWPWARIARCQDFTNRCLDPLYTAVHSSWMGLRPGTNVHPYDSGVVRTYSQGS